MSMLTFFTTCSNREPHDRTFACVYGWVPTLALVPLAGHCVHVNTPALHVDAHQLHNLTRMHHAGTLYRSMQSSRAHNRYHSSAYGRGFQAADHAAKKHLVKCKGAPPHHKAVRAAAASLLPHGCSAVMMPVKARHRASLPSMQMAPPPRIAWCGCLHMRTTSCQ